MDLHGPSIGYFKEIMKVKYILIIILLLISTSFAQEVKVEQRNVCFTEKEVDNIIEQFKKDKSEIQKYIKRNEKLRKEKPKIEYEFLDNNKVKQHITIEVYQDNPLQYEIEFTINPKEKEEGWFPMKLWLGAFLINSDFKENNFTDLVDAKIGIKLISLSPLNMTFIRNIGFNAAIGIKSTGGTISYNFGKPFNNTNLHLFYGIEYSTPVKNSFGIGCSLNF